ncbi:MAG: efflux RND transporter periplasmic adaptor subunit [Acidobacteria bacterium]|nr:efflux RND transporter periplasmic adaptor subunit [Acidobacteriota bacterium]
MDIPRALNPRKKWLKRIGGSLLVIGALGGITVFVSRLKPAAPTVEWNAVWSDVVKRGPMVREVRGVGSLVPEELLWVPARTSGRVERKLMLPGARVTKDTLLLVLSDPAIQLAAVESEFQVKAAEARYQDLVVQLRGQRLSQQAQVALVETEYQQARLRADRNEALAKEGLLAGLDLELARSNAELLGNRRKIEKERFDIRSESDEAQLAVAKAEVERLKALAALRRSEVDALQVRAGADGVLQQLPVEVGQHVTPGLILAKVAQPTRLKAELKVPETQAKDVLVGQVVQIDTRNGIVRGLVARVDPTVKDGTVTVDVGLEGRLPVGARPDMSVDGVIEIERLPDALFVGRPAFAQSGSTVSLFRVEPDGKTAVRVRVEFGRSSVSVIEVARGLRKGDRVILSDMTAYDAYDRIALR